VIGFEPTTLCSARNGPPRKGSQLQAIFVASAAVYTGWILFWRGPQPEWAQAPIKVEVFDLDNAARTSAQNNRGQHPSGGSALARGRRGISLSQRHEIASDCMKGEDAIREKPGGVERRTGLEEIETGPAVRSASLLEQRDCVVVKRWEALPTGSTGCGNELRIPPVDLWATT
jgi:hypothetical protein